MKLLAFATFLSAALALPNAVPRQAQAFVYSCTDVNWSGNCTNFAFPFESCFHYPNPYFGKISSVGPAAHNYCRFFDTQNCGQDGNPNVPFFDINGPPGYADLTTLPYQNQAGQNWNDRIQAVHCSQN